MGNLVRIGDAISCGSAVAGGSGNVFANELPVTHSGTPPTTGHGCFPGSVLVGGWSGTVFVNNNPVALLGITNMAPHRCGKLIHGGVTASASPDVSVEA